MRKLAFLLCAFLALPAYAHESWVVGKECVANAAALPATGNTAGDFRCVLDTLEIYSWDGLAWNAYSGGGGGGTLSGDVDGPEATTDLDEVAVETELESVLDLQDLQGAVTDAQVPDNITIGDTALAAGAVDGGTGGEIADDTVTAADLAADSVGASEIAAGAVGSSEIATDAVGADELDALAVETELEAVLDLGDMSFAGSYTAYDPEIPNANCDASYSDEFHNGAASLTWTTFNSPTTAAANGHGYTVIGSTARIQRGVAIAAPGAVDWVTTVRLYYSGSSTVTTGCGTGVLYGGTLAAPNGFVFAGVDDNGSTNADWRYILFYDANYDSTAGATTVASDAGGNWVFGRFEFCIQMRYDTSSTTLTTVFSLDCANSQWLTLTGNTINTGADPTHILLSSRAGGACHAEWVRTVLTSSDFLPGRVVTRYFD